MNKPNIAVIMGGYSSEKDISMESGSVVFNTIPKDIFNVYRVHILKSGWVYVDPSGAEHPINKADFSFSTATGSLVPDAVFNVIHGTPGEDGYMQAYFELLGIPQTSCDFYQAALTFNKRDCLSVLKTFGVQCATSYYVNKNQVPELHEIVKTVGFPCFVKPNRAGSSYGISKVNSLEQMPEALEKAFIEDNQVLIETALVGPEVSVGVALINGEVQVYTPTEIVPENDFFDYEAKYLGQSEEITPARISDLETKRVQEETRRIYSLLEMRGLARCDFILQDGMPYFLEINTNPGLSKESIIPRQLGHLDVPLSKLFTGLIREVLPVK